LFVGSFAVAETKTFVRWFVRCSRDEDGAILCNPYKDEERHAAARQQEEEEVEEEEEDEKTK